MSSEYTSSFSTSDIHNLSSLITTIEINDANQSCIDKLSETVCNVYLIPAIDKGLAKNKLSTCGEKGNTCRPKSKPKCINWTHKPWFTKGCHLLRSDYLKTKRKLKKSLKWNFVRRALFIKELLGKLRPIFPQNLIQI